MTGRRPMQLAFRSRVTLLGMIGWMVLALVGVGCAPEPSPVSGAAETVTRLTEALGGMDTEGYLRAERPRDFVFPRDHGPHPGFRNEWWYITGNLDAENGDRFGFHITFFRVALAPRFEGDEVFLESPWSARHIWMAHAAITDVAGRRHVSEERFAREGAGLAGAIDNGEKVWLEDWTLSGMDGDLWRLILDAGPYALNLELAPARGPVLQGEDGLSQKGREPGDASYYYSSPRIAVRGSVRKEGEEQPVAGQAWLDREWSTSALDDDQVGWDWFALQLDDGTDIMYYQLRRSDGSPDPHSKGRWIPADGPDRLLQPDDVELVPLRYSRMASGRRYPVAWRLSLPEFGRDLRIEAVLDEQEMQSFIPYWEGAVDIRDSDGLRLGRGFVELTGYDEP
ncbi:MAG: carotenoid 1,2-hydratase [Thioalkalivibrio sp.]|nr:carotenoid 1,2-hydratase [Thioalkalivibrio sp.]